jgi:flagella basal body P-ring formation protein FlgA
MMLRRLLLGLMTAAGLLLAAGASAWAQETVIVATRVVYPGEVISGDALDEVPLRRQLRNPSSIAFGWAQLEGKVARRTLLPGRMIPLSYVRDSYLVEPGEPVQVVFSHGGLEISVTGVPLQSGAAGDVVRVRNLDTGAVLTGVVMADGTIRVSA